MGHDSTLENIVRTGTVSSVDVENRTARVAFADKLDTEGKPLISGPLKIIQNQPLITIEKWVMESGTENKWELSAQYASADRKLGLEETYKTDVPDVIENKKIIKYEKTEALSSCALTVVLENKLNRETVKVYPWLPYIGQFVLCLFLPNGESDGFVLGGI